ncbi:hypothetical protein ILYODFUR_034516 [Ilyodon furcidens]|uniref:Transmembrane protein n=1 Tax=Ilyodon furcidens TaxID=33524 RepID=A0ABV0UXP7_9TELE
MLKHVFSVAAFNVWGPSVSYMAFPVVVRSRELSVSSTMATHSAVSLSLLLSPALCVRCSVNPLPPLVIMVHVITSIFLALEARVSQLEARFCTVEKPADSHGP